MKIKIEVKIVKVPQLRLIFTGIIWDSQDLQFCIHGEKLRWTCDDCNEYFRRKRKK